MNIIWVVIVASGGLGNGTTWASQQQCQMIAAKVGGMCMPMAAQPQPAQQQPSDGGLGLYTQCYITGTCPRL